MELLIEPKLKFTGQELEVAPADSMARRTRAPQDVPSVLRAPDDPPIYGPNPFRDEPHPGVVFSVRRLGLLGLLLSAMAAAVARVIRPSGR